MKVNQLFEWDYKGDSSEESGWQKFDVGVTVCADVDFLDISSLYDGDDEKIKDKMRLKALNTRMSDPHWLDEDDLAKVESALTEINVDVELASWVPADEDTWPQLDFRVKVNLAEEPPSPQGVSIGKWSRRDNKWRWKVAIEYKIMDTLKGLGKVSNDMDCNFDEL